MTAPSDVVDRLRDALNDHDLDALAACFASGYVNETPVHPARGFRGRDQVRRNWEQIFAFVPDVHAQVLRVTSADDTVWTEWEMAGTRRDGAAHKMAGVVLFGVEGERTPWARFYLEPVDDDATTVDDAVRRQVVR